MPLLMNFRLFVLPSLYLAALLLSGCAYTTEGSIADVRVEAIGAEDAICYAYVDGLKFKFYPPQTINLPKSHNDMTLDCRAPGNRRVKKVIEPVLSDFAFGNVAGAGIPIADARAPAVAGSVAWDALSGAMFKYPEVIYMDFTSVETKPSAFPAHNNPDIKQPEEYALEEFLPDSPRLNSDIGRTYEPPKKRGESSSNSEYGSDYILIDDGKDSKSNLKNVINPSNGPSPKTATGSPAPLYPGQ